MNTKQKILVIIGFIAIYIILIIALAYVGDARILPCNIKCGGLSSSDEFFISQVKELENTNYCSLHGLNIIESKYGCKIDPSIYSNIFYSVFYLLVMPLIITIFFVRIIKRKIATKNFE